MKIQISDNAIDSIENYELILFNGENINIKHSDNSINEILCLHLLNKISIEKFEEILSLICKKLRINGKIIISGIDLGLFSRSIFFKELDLSAIHDILNNCSSMYDVEFVVERLKNFGLTIVTSEIKGLEYEISAIRKIL